MSPPSTSRKSSCPLPRLPLRRPRLKKTFLHQRAPPVLPGVPSSSVPSPAKGGRARPPPPPLRPHLRLRPPLWRRPARNSPRGHNGDVSTHFSPFVFFNY